MTPSAAATGPPAAATRDELRRLLVDGLKARQDAECAVLAERPHMSTPQTSGIGDPIKGTVRRTGPKSTAGCASLRCASVDGARGTSDTSSKSKARGISANNSPIASDGTAAAVCISSLWNTPQMSELADRATDVAARIAELQGHL